MLTNKLHNFVRAMQISQQYDVQHVKYCPITTQTCFTRLYGCVYDVTIDVQHIRDTTRHEFVVH